jgi:hypothetical protein
MTKDAADLYRLQMNWPRTPQAGRRLGRATTSASFKGRFTVGTREFQGGKPSAVRTDGASDIVYRLTTR